MLSTCALPFLSICQPLPAVMLFLKPLDLISLNNSVTPWVILSPSFSILLVDTLPPTDTLLSILAIPLTRSSPMVNLYAVSSSLSLCNRCASYSINSRIAELSMLLILVAEDSLTSIATLMLFTSSLSCCVLPLITALPRVISCSIG